MSRAEPVEFTLGGHRFSCVVEPDLASVLALARAPEPEDDEAAAVLAILAFVGPLIVEGDRRRWRRMVKRNLKPRRLRRPASPVSAADVVALAYWLVEAYTGHPSGPSSSSAAGRRPSGARSSGSSSPSQDETSEHSP